MPEPSGLTTDLVPEGTVNRYFTVARAQAATATMFTGSANSNVVFTYDAEHRLLSANVAVPAPNPSGIMSVNQDPAPRLGGNLDLNGHTIIGNVSIGNNLQASTISGILIGTERFDYDDICDPGVSVGSMEMPATLFGYTGNTHAVFTGLTNTTDVNSGFYTRQSRGTLSNPSPVDSADLIYRVSVQGFAGNTFQTTATMSVQVEPDATVASDYIPSQWVLQTFNKEHKNQDLKFNSSGVLTAPVFQAASYASDSYPNNPEAGWIIFDSTVKRFYGYNGLEWVAFTGL
jgi:hypothetical protein